MTPEKLGKYEIRGTLGQGAMGVVYDGWDPLILRRVAIKTVALAHGEDADAAEGVERFRREAQAAGRLQHPNIVSVFDFGETETLAYIVMEFMDGGTLKDVLDREKKLPPAQACDMMCHVLSALSYSHARGVVHRDVKPANIMLDQNGAVKLGDFGIARIESSSMTLVGDVLGTPAYMAPEQFLGETADARADIFAAGATLFHLLTGSRPYEGSRTTVRQKVLTATVAPSATERAPEVPAALDAVLQRAMARHAADRFQNATDFATAVRASLLTPVAAAESSDDATVFIRGAQPDATQATSVRPTVTPAAPPTKTKRRGVPIGLLVGAGVLVAAAGGAAWYFTQGPTPPAPVVPMPKPIAPPSSPIVTPKNPAPEPVTPPPPPSPAVAASAANAAAAGIACALARVQPAAAGIHIAGVAGAGLPDTDLRGAVARAAGGTAVDWSSVRDVDDIFCATLDSVRGAWKDRALDLGLEDQNDTGLAPANTILMDGMHIKPAIGGLDFPAYVRVDYVQRDGSVEHMFPRRRVPGNPRKRIPAVAADPERQLPAESTMVLGREPQTPGANQTWDAGTPYGTDLIIAVASSEEFDIPERSNNEANASAYLAALKQAIDTAAAHGARLAAGVIPVTTAPK